MSGETSPEGFQTETHQEIFKKFKRFKSSIIGFSSPGVLGCFFFSLCLIFCLFLLDYRTLTRPGQPLMVSWFGFNDSLKSLSDEGNGNGTGTGKVGFLEENGGYCDIFDGSWVWDDSYPLYKSRDCTFLDEGFRCSENGRPDNFYTKWRWQPKDCNLPRFSNTSPVFSFSFCPVLISEFLFWTQV